MRFREAQDRNASCAPRIVACALLLAGLLGATKSSGTTFRQLTLDEMATTAEAVVRAQCLSSESRWEGGEIWTLTRFELVEIVKGNVPRLLTVRMLGGRVGHLHSIVEGAPAFNTGEEVYLFLGGRRKDSFSVLGWSQGTFRIRSNSVSGREVVTQDSAGLAALDKATGKFARKGIRNLLVEEFRQRIARAVDRPSGGQP